MRRRRGAKAFRRSSGDAADYIVSNVGDLESVLDNGDATLSGKRIALMPGSYDTLGEINFYGRFTGLTSPLTIEAVSQGNKPTLNRWHFEAPSGTTGNVHFNNIRFFREHDTFDSPTDSQFVKIAQGRPSENILFDGCLFESDFGKARDGFVAVYQVRGIDCIKACNSLIVINSLFRNMAYGVAAAGSNILIEDNEMYYLWGDSINLHIPEGGGSNTSNVLIKQNYSHDPTGDIDFLHPNFLHSWARNDPPDAGNFTGIRITENVVIFGVEGPYQTPPADPNGGPTYTGPFMQNAGGSFDDITIDRNIICTPELNGIAIEAQLRNSTIELNRLGRPWVSDINGDLVINNLDGFNNYTAPAIYLTNVDSSVNVRDNVCEAIIVDSGAPTTSGNVTSLSRFDIETYRAVYQGTNFNPTTREEAEAEFALQ